MGTRTVDRAAVIDVARSCLRGRRHRDLTGRHSSIHYMAGVARARLGGGGVRTWTPALVVVTAPTDPTCVCDSAVCVDGRGLLPHVEDCGYIALLSPTWWF